MHAEAGILSWRIHLHHRYRITDLADIASITDRSHRTLYTYSHYSTQIFYASHHHNTQVR
jgi:hypothetical protein